MNIFHDLNPKYVSRDKFTAVVEIPAGSKNKYELDKETGLLRLDRVLSTATRYPANYGFIPLTYCDDGDPLDVLILTQETIYPLTEVDCKPIGVINMIDGGEMDYKIICVPTSDPQYKNYNDISELPKHIFDEIKHFFLVYKALENKTTEIDGIEGSTKAKQIVDESIALYKKKFIK